jgi:hypothetical protein
LQVHIAFIRYHAFGGLRTPKHSQYPNFSACHCRAYDDNFANFSAHGDSGSIADFRLSDSIAEYRRPPDIFIR